MTSTTIATSGASRSAASRAAAVGSRLLLHRDDERDVPRGPVGCDPRKDLEADEDPHTIVQSRREHSSVRQQHGRPVEHDRVAGPHELERVGAPDRTDVDAKRIPRRLAVPRRDHDATNLAVTRVDPDALPECICLAPVGELRNGEQPVLAGVAHRQADLVRVGEESDRPPTGRASNGRDGRAQHVRLHLGADRRRLTPDDRLHRILGSRGTVRPKQLVEERRECHDGRLLGTERQAP